MFDSDSKHIDSVINMFKAKNLIGNKIKLSYKQKSLHNNNSRIR